MNRSQPLYPLPILFAALYSCTSRFFWMVIWMTSLSTPHHLPLTCLTGTVLTEVSVAGSVLIFVRTSQSLSYPVVPNQGWFFPLGGIQQWLETFCGIAVGRRFGVSQWQDRSFSRVLQPEVYCRGRDTLVLAGTPGRFRSSILTAFPPALIEFSPDLSSSEFSVSFLAIPMEDSSPPAFYRCFPGFFSSHSSWSSSSVRGFNLHASHVPSHLYSQLQLSWAPVTSFFTSVVHRHFNTAGPK